MIFVLVKTETGLYIWPKGGVYAYNESDVIFEGKYFQCLAQKAKQSFQNVVNNGNDIYRR